MSNLYDDKSIESLTPLAFTRLRPGVYAGDTTYSTQLVVEIVSNAVDEFRLGHGNEIDVEIDKDVVTVRDFGQGFIPNSFREDGKTILEAAFSVLNTSGKYREDGTYEGTSLGSFGIGSKITTFLSNWLVVETHRDNEYEKIVFNEGEFSERLHGPWTKESGTIVSWKASKEFFTHPEPEVNKLKSLFKTIVCLCPGLTIVLKDNGVTTTFYSKNGLDDLADDMIGNKEIINNRMNVKFIDGKYKLDLILTYTSNYSSTFVSYVNAGLVEQSPIQTQLKASLTREMNKFFREKKWIKDSEENLSGDDIQEGLFIVFNATCPNVAYDSQVKTRVVSMDCKSEVAAFVENLQTWLVGNEKEIKVIADKAISARKAREAAKKARDAVRDKQPKNKKKALLSLPTKLVDCWAKDRTKCELLISEGDSAANGLVDGRDSEIHAIFPIRGKIIAAYKNSIEKIFSNQEVVNLIKALGLELDPKTQKLIYDKKKLRYGKILLAADADPDGASIKNLLIELLWWLCPELILNGHVYTTMPPLFRITTKKNEYIYLKDANELEKYKKEHLGEKFLINRNKGLGEQDADELAEALLNESTRNIAQITVEDEQYAARMIDILLGPSVPPRRAFLLAHEEEAVENE